MLTGNELLRGTLALTIYISDRFISALDVPITKSYPIYRMSLSTRYGDYIISLRHTVALHA